MRARLAHDVAMVAPGTEEAVRGGMRRAGRGRRIRSIAMSTGADGAPSVTAGHVPVLLDRVVEWLAVRDGGLYVDGTFGAGGYARAILRTAGARVIGIDRDRTAIARGADLVSQAQGRLELVEERFGELQSVVAESSADGIVFDLGVSSMQLDRAERGFSFRLDGPLDMRMGHDGPTAADIVARAPERDLAAIIATLGEERQARAGARAILQGASGQTSHNPGAPAK